MSLAFGSSDEHVKGLIWHVWGVNDTFTGVRKTPLRYQQDTLRVLNQNQYIDFGLTP